MLIKERNAACGRAQDHDKARCLRTLQHMRDFDFSSLYRSAWGRDSSPSVLNESNSPAPTSFPPYSVEQFGEDSYRLTLVVAGFAEHELQIESDNGQLLIRGCRGGVNHKGLALWQRLTGKAFHSSFQLAEHVYVLGAQLEHGLLHIELQRDLPERGRQRILINRQHSKRSDKIR